MSASARPLSFVLTLGVAACASAATASDPAPSAGPGPASAQAAAPAAAPAAEAPAVGAASFSVAQADRGRDTFRSMCTECHYSSEFSDAQFKFKWSRRSAGNLYELIYTQMPESAPGSLSPEEAVGVVAYVMRMNGFEPGGEELTADRAVLDAISLASIRD